MDPHHSDNPLNPRLSSRSNKTCDRTLDRSFLSLFFRDRFPKRLHAIMIAIDSFPLLSLFSSPLFLPLSFFFFPLETYGSYAACIMYVALPFTVENVVARIKSAES